LKTVFPAEGSTTLFVSMQVFLPLATTEICITCLSAKNKHLTAEKSTYGRSAAGLQIQQANLKPVFATFYLPGPRYKCYLRRFLVPASKKCLRSFT